MDRLNLDEGLRAISGAIAPQESSIARNTFLLAFRSASKPVRHQKNPTRFNSAACNRDDKACGHPLDQGPSVAPVPSKKQPRSTSGFQTPGAENDSTAIAIPPEESPADSLLPLSRERSVGSRCTSRARAKSWWKGLHPEWKSFRLASCNSCEASRARLLRWISHRR